MEKAKQGRPAKAIKKLTDEQKREVEANMRLVYSMVNKHRFKHLPEDDQCQEGMVALANSIQGYGEGEGVKFSTYAGRAIKNEILDAVRNHRMIHVPVFLFSEKQKDHKFQADVEKACRLVSIDGVTHDCPLHPATPEKPEPRLDSWERASIRMVVQRLPAVERDVVRGLVFRGETCEQLGLKHKLSRQRIWQIKNEVFAKLKTRLAKYA